MTTATQLQAPPAGQRLDGMHTAVLGPTGGLGRAIAVELARAGGEVHLIGRRPDELNRLAADLRSLGSQATVQVIDLDDLGQLQAAVAGLPALDVFVNAVGINIPRPVLEVTVEQVDTMLAVNVRAAFFALQAAARRLVDDGRPGSLITISSQLGHVGCAGRSVYAATKHAVEGLTKSLAVELAPHRVRVNTVAPTFVRTPMTAAAFEDDDFTASITARIPLGRLGTPEEVAAAVLFLAAPTSSLVTGTSIIVDGGWTAQ